MAINPIRHTMREQTAADPAPELTLIQALEAQQKSEALSAVAFISGCGLDQALWSRVRRGRERFGVNACAKIVERYPEMRAAAARYLTESYGHTALTLLEDASRLVRSRRATSRRTACR